MLLGSYAPREQSMHVHSDACPRGYVHSLAPFANSAWIKSGRAGFDKQTLNTIPISLINLPRFRAGYLLGGKSAFPFVLLRTIGVDNSGTLEESQGGEKFLLAEMNRNIFRLWRSIRRSREADETPRKSSLLPEDRKNF